MSWRSSGSTNAELVNNLCKHNIISNEAVRDVMLAVDRAFFVKSDPYEDRPQSIGFGATISAPHMHAYALSLLEPNLRPGGRALDVGSGSGIMTTFFALMLGPTGMSVGIEHVNELHKQSEINIQNWLSSNPRLNGSDIDVRLDHQIMLLMGDGRKGCSEFGPYDAIHVGAAAPSIPNELVAQLKPGGRMLCPVGPEGGQQNLVQIDRDVSGKISQKDIMGVMYIPLTDLERQEHGQRKEL